jgi:hypothetical protein
MPMTFDPWPSSVILQNKTNIYYNYLINQYRLNVKSKGHKDAPNLSGVAAERIQGIEPYPKQPGNSSVSSLGRYVL